LAGESGSAILDLIGFAVLLQIPILMFATFSLATQQQAFAIESIARHALRAEVIWPDESSTSEVVNQLAKDLGLERRLLEYEISCEAKCGTPLSLVHIRVRYQGLEAHATALY
jgi:hypothetical protein